MARPRIDEDTAFNSAVKRFKVLVTYFDVTRPQYEPLFKENGKFQKKRMFHMFEFLRRWNPHAHHTPQQHKAYVVFSRAFNYTFGIPSTLVSQVLGKWRDEYGVQHRIPVAKVVRHLVDEGWLKGEMSAGARFKKVNGDFEKKYWFNKKYLISDKTWNGLLDNPIYSDYTNYPGAKNDQDVQKVVGIVSK